MSKVCAPSASAAATVNLAAQSVNASPSTRHCTETGSPVTVNAQLGSGTGVAPSGPRVIVMIGTTESADHVASAGVGSMLPAASTARSPNVWLPPSNATDSGDVQAANAAPSSE